MFKELVILVLNIYKKYQQKQRMEWKNKRVESIRIFKK